MGKGDYHGASHIYGSRAGTSPRAEYREFDHQLSIMKEHPELKRQIDEFRQENYVLQRTAESDELFDKLDEFSQRYDSFRRNPLVDPFLNAEAEFCRMIQEINQEIVEAVNFG